MKGHYTRDDKFVLDRHVIVKCRPRESLNREGFLMQELCSQKQRPRSSHGIVVKPQKEERITFPSVNTYDVKEMLRSTTADGKGIRSSNPSNSLSDPRTTPSKFPTYINSNKKEK